MSIFNLPVAKRTRLQWQLLAQESGGSRRTLNVAKRVDESEEETSNEDGSYLKEISSIASEGSSRSTRRRLYEAETVDEESEEEKSNENGAAEVCSILRRRVDEPLVDDKEKDEMNNMESPEISKKSYGSACFFKTGTRTYVVYTSDESDTDDTVVTLEEDEEVDEDLQIYEGIQSQSTEYESSSCRESESDNSDFFDFLLPNKRPNQLTSMKKVNLKPMKKTNAKDPYTTVDKANAVKNQRRVSRNDHGAFLDSLLDSIIGNGGDHREEGDDRLPLRFRFDESEDESPSHESDTEGLFKEMDFALTCDEIGSHGAQAVKNQEKHDAHDDDETNHFKLCQRGEHSDVYLEEQIGFRCGLCGAVILESRYVIPKLANYAPDRSKRSYLSDEQQEFSSSEFEAPEWNRFDICKQSKGTVWELIPTSIRAHLYPHQQEGFKFLWENLAGTIELSRLDKLAPHGGGGCIISHAPGTGKTLLTIVFIESFLKKYPKCCPVIVAPASMLLTWEAEFKKWQVGFSFLNLNSSEFLGKEMVNGNIKRSKDLVRVMKISSWSKGGSVLGVSYSLYEKLAGNTKNAMLEKMGNVLLDKPGLVVLDEGHTPRNQRSNIWNVLLKLKTKNRVILSGTPFQNNFRELFNTLHLVRPATAKDIVNQTIFAEMIHPKNRKKSRGGSASEDIEKLKAIISPFVHVHKGNILKSKLPGLKSSVILLNPPPLQKRLLRNLGNLAKTFEYEHKVALVSAHPSLILHCSLSEKEENSVNKQELEKARIQPDIGVKTRFVMELIRLSISLDEKVLIFSQYIEPLKLLKDQMALTFGWDKGREIMIIQGKIHQKHRQTIINDFNDPNGEVKVLLASTRCCSEGIHLVGASRVVLLDIVWNPSVERQAISRAYRLGQKKAVYTYHLMACGTTEEDKYDRQVEKGRLAELVFSSSAMAGEVPNSNTIKLSDKILQQMVDHQELKSIFMNIRCPEKPTTN